MCEMQNERRSAHDELLALGALFGRPHGVGARLPAPPRHKLPRRLPPVNLHPHRPHLAYMQRHQLLVTQHAQDQRQASALSSERRRQGSLVLQSGAVHSTTSGDTLQQIHAGCTPARGRHLQDVAGEPCGDGGLDGRRQLAVLERANAAGVPWEVRPQQRPQPPPLRLGVCISARLLQVRLPRLCCVPGPSQLCCCCC